MSLCRSAFALFYLVISATSFSNPEPPTAVPGRRVGTTVATFSPRSFTSKGGTEKANGLVVEFPKVNENADWVRRWGAFHYLKNCACSDNNSNGYCCPIVRPEPVDVLLESIPFGFTGSGKLRVYLDLWMGTYQSPDAFGYYGEATTPQSREFDIWKGLVQIEISGNRIPTTVRKIGFVEMRHFRQSGLASRSPISGVGHESYEIAPDRAFFEMAATNPDNVIVRIRASRDLVGLVLRSMEMEWIKQDRSDL